MKQTEISRAQASEKEWCVFCAGKKMPRSSGRAKYALTMSELQKNARHRRKIDSRKARKENQDGARKPDL